jgi:hypothetical protein
MSLLAVVSACVSVLLYVLIGNRKAELEQEVVQLRSQLAAARQNSQESTSGREEVAARASALERELNELKARNVTLEARNSQLARDVTQLGDQLQARERAERGAAAEMADLRRQLVDAKSALAASTVGTSSEQVAAYEARIADLEGQLSYMRQSGSGRSLADDLARVPENLAGTVLEVGPKAAYVVLNIGSRNGAVPSLEMVLRRGSTTIARVRLTDVRDSYSVAHVLPSTGTGTIRAGDKATRS